jgi:hypothetical protein
MYIQNSGTLDFVNSTLTDNIADDSGGGLYMDTGDQVRAVLNESIVQKNQAKGQGSGIFVSRDAVLESTSSLFRGNGGVTLTGKNEGGGAITGVDASINITSCVFTDNTAGMGGAILADRATRLYIGGKTLFTTNSADLMGGAIAARLKASDDSVVVVGGANFSQNTADVGGAVSVADGSVVHLTNSTFRSNAAQQGGGAVFVTESGQARVNGCGFQANTAARGGAVHVAATFATRIEKSTFTDNVASARGGALYYASIGGVTTREIDCRKNQAKSGGCLFWVTYNTTLRSTLVPCTDCITANNTKYEVATNTRNVTVMWWPTNVTSGVATMEPRDEESFTPINTTEKSLSDTKLIWPRLQAVDLYNQIEVLDTVTECAVTSAIRGELLFQPWGRRAAIAGIVSFVAATFEGGQPRETLPYALNMTCVLPEKKTLRFTQNVTLLPCPAGYSTANSGFVTIV